MTDRKEDVSLTQVIAELDAKIVETAEYWFEMWEYDNDKYGDRSRLLAEVIRAKRKALTPPSLEEEIAAYLREHPTLGPEATAEGILALIDGHNK